MDDYEIEFVRSAHKELAALPRQVSDRIERAVENLRTEPRPPGAKNVRLGQHLYRIRVGDYRVVYQLDDAKELITITRVRHRSDAYR